MKGPLTEVNVTLGTKYKDLATGFVGTATAKCIYVDGQCNVRLDNLSADGKSIVETWVDVARLDFAKEGE
jgi:hypothetical protein